MKKYHILYFVTIGVILTLLVGACKKDTDSFSQAEYDEKVILEHTSKLITPFEKHESGIYYHIETQGDGQNPSPTSKVTVNYEGWLINGFVFDATQKGKTATFKLNEVIKGWQIGIPLIKAGGKIKLIIPSALGYGSASQGSIPANSVLIFEVELVSFE